MYFSSCELARRTGGKITGFLVKKGKQSWNTELTVSSKFRGKFKSQLRKVLEIYFSIPEIPISGIQYLY